LSIQNTCWPQILASCSQASEEARDIVYNNQITIKIKARDDINLSVGRTDLEYRNDGRSPRWPGSLHHATRLLIDLEVTKQGQAAQRLRQTNAVIVNLVDMLDASSKLKCVGVRCSATAMHPGDTRLSSLIWPLAKFESVHVKLAVEGALKAELAKHPPMTSASLQALQRTLSAVKDHIEKYRALCNGADLPPGP
jgi:hypothetical protein